MMRVTGYEDGVAYVVQCDPSRKPDSTSSEDGIEGVVSHASPGAILALLASEQDQPVRMFAESATIKGGTHSCAAVLATLVEHTEVIRVEGDDTPSMWNEASTPASRATIH